MYKVLIVDDEKYVISLIEKLVDWKRLGMEVIGSAGDGMQGIELVEKLKPDILVADVKMPGFDGISLIKRVREIDRDIKFIVISGHKKFEYAKSVMKYNVEDYLLKPIDKEELESILQKIRNELDIRNAQRSTEGKINKWMDSNRELLNTQFMEELYSGKLFEKKQNLEEANHRYFTDLGDYIYQCVFIQLNGLNGNMESSFVEDFLTALKSETEAIFRENCPVAMSCPEYHRMIVLLGCEEEKVHLIEHIMNKVLEKGLDMAAKYPGLRIAFGVSRSVKTDGKIEGLRGCVQSAAEALDKRFTEGYGKILYSDPALEKVETEKNMLDETMREALSKAMRSTSETEVYRQIKNIYDVKRNQIYRNPRVCVKLAEEINEELYHYLRLFNHAEGMKEELKKQLRQTLIDSSNLVELTDFLTRYVCKRMEEMVGDSKSNLSQAVRTAKIFIMNNYMKDIRLNEVASVVNLTPVYFSSLFKKEMGESFIDYLNRVRIDAAKILLKDVRNNISEIAEQCGFSDTRYFAKTFKKIVGITPSDYRKRQMD